MTGPFPPPAAHLALAAAVAMAALSSPAHAQVVGPADTKAAEATAATAQLAEGIAAVQAGNYQPAVTVLSSALRGLAQDPARQADLVRAYLHLGVAFAGLGQDSPARSQFTQALLRKPDATLEVKNAPESARRIFQEARGEAAPVIAAAEERKKKASKTPLVLAGVAAVGAGVGVASVSGGSQEDDGPPPTFGPLEPGPQFRFAGVSGNPFLGFGGGQPASGSTIQVGTARPRFTYEAQVSTFGAPVGPFARLQATVELVTLDRGPCWRAESAIFALSAGQVVELVIDAFPPTPSCTAPFNTLTVEARLFDREAGRQLSSTTYSGGYKVVP